MAVEGTGEGGGRRDSAFVVFLFGRSRTWVEKLVSESKAAELALASPRCTAPAPSAVACQRVWGRGAEMAQSPWPSHRK